MNEARCSKSPFFSFIDYWKIVQIPASGIHPHGHPDKRAIEPVPIFLGYFYEKGIRHGCKVETRPGIGKAAGEYIVDLCWWSDQSGQYWLELALESEWQPGKGEIEQDFYKLIDVKARLKVWVCCWGERQMQARQTELVKAIAGARFRFPEEEYLIVSLPDSQKAEWQDCLLVNWVLDELAGQSQSVATFSDISELLKGKLRDSSDFAWDLVSPKR